MEIITTKDYFGGELIYLKVGLVKGKNFLKRIGYVEQPNPLYLKRGSNEYFHYNRSLGKWIYEKVEENRSTVFSGDF